MIVLSEDLAVIVSQESQALVKLLFA